MPSESNKNPCFTDFAIQEFLLGRLDSRVRADAEAHLESCPECSACFELLSKETAALRAGLLESSKSESPAPEISDETLAMYLDNSLQEKARQQVELGLAGSPESLMRLNAMRQELNSVLSDTETTESVSLPPEGRVLRMPKRQVFPRKLSDLLSQESEAAEG